WSWQGSVGHSARQARAQQGFCFRKNRVLDEREKGFCAPSTGDWDGDGGVPIQPPIWHNNPQLSTTLDSKFRGLVSPPAVDRVPLRPSESKHDQSPNGLDSNRDLLLPQADLHQPTWPLSLSLARSIKLKSVAVAKSANPAHLLSLRRTFVAGPIPPQ